MRVESNAATQSRRFFVG